MFSSPIDSSCSKQLQIFTLSNIIDISSKIYIITIRDTFTKPQYTENERETEALVYILYFKRSKRAFSLKEIARELAYASVLVGVDS